MIRLLQRGVAKQAKETMEDISKMPSKKKQALGTNIFYHILSAENGSTLAPFSIASAPYNDSQKAYFPVKKGGVLVTAYASTPEREAKQDSHIPPSLRKQLIGRTKAEVIGKYDVDITANNSSNDLRSKFQYFLDRARNWNGTKWTIDRK